MQKPYTKEEFDRIVKQGEERLGVQHFYTPKSSIKESVIHDEDCRCQTCINIKLDAILAAGMASLETLTKSLGENKCEDIYSFPDSVV